MKRNFFFVVFGLAWATIYGQQIKAVEDFKFVTEFKVDIKNFAPRAFLIGHQKDFIIFNEDIMAFPGIDSAIEGEQTVCLYELQTRQSSIDCVKFIKEHGRFIGVPLLAFVVVMEEYDEYLPHGDIFAFNEKSNLFQNSGGYWVPLLIKKSDGAEFVLGCFNYYSHRPGTYIVFLKK